MVGWWVGEEVSEMCEEDKNTKIQTFHYKISKSWGCNVHHGDYINNTVCILESGKRVDLEKFSS